VTGVTPSPADQPGRELAGHLGVEATARRVRHYRYAEERIMRVMAGWIALTPEVPAKLLLGRQVWDCAQHADQWGKRLPELRAPAQVSESPGPDFTRFLDTLEEREGWAETIERLAGVYRVLKPHLVAVYAAHLDRVNPVYEPPTRRILERCLADERCHVADGEAVLGALARTPAERARAEAWERDLRRRLDASGGVTGSGT
jgi:1,2-phenylacetyl-CoA epoxidase catalytic subunit